MNSLKTYFVIETNDYDEIENIMHDIFRESRVIGSDGGKTEMFALDKERAKRVLNNAGYYLEEQVNRHPLKTEHFVKYLKKLLDIYGFHEREKNTDPEPMTYLFTYDMNVTMFEISEKGEYDDEIMVNILFSGISSDGSVYTIVANGTSYDGDNIEDFKADLDQVFNVK